MISELPDRSLTALAELALADPEGAAFSAGYLGPDQVPHLLVALPDSVLKPLLAKMGQDMPGETLRVMSTEDERQVHIFALVPVR